MKNKVILSLLLSIVFVIGTLGSTTSAESNTKPSVKSIKDVTSKTEVMEVIDANELPDGTEFIEFDTVEEFEDFLKKLEKEQINKQKASIIDLDNAPQVDDSEISMLAAAKNTTKVLKVTVKPSWNPLKSLAQPVRVTVDLGYRYTGSGSNAKFSKINKVTSYSLGIPTDWKQTSKSTSITSSKKAVNVNLNGYHLLGIKIGGQPLGAKISDTIKFQYKIGGATTITAK